MTLLDAFDGVLSGRDAKILATDISTRMLDQAEMGRYPVNQLLNTESCAIVIVRFSRNEWRDVSG